jgi:3-isopropylmalate/(R)-2-methylmalate dehydratase small subunit
MPTPFTSVSGAATPLRLANIDTDVIIRIERLTSGDIGALGHWAFEALRYLPDGSENPDTPFNQPKWRGAPILLAGHNFGCGSSREAAVNAMAAMGVRCVIADSFGDIFYANCFQNGMLPVRLPGDAVSALMDLSEASDEPFEVDLTTCEIRAPGGRVEKFDIDPFRREALLAGLDDIGLTLRDDPLITAWQAKDKAERPWVWEQVSADTSVGAQG